MTMQKFAPLYILFPITLLCLCLLFPNACREGVSAGLTLSLHTALPALFPPLVLSCMISLFIQQKNSSAAKILPLLGGIACGFPVGAAMAADLVENAKLTRREGEKMLFFCNNTGPGFLILFCGKVLLGNVMIGWFLFLAQSALSLLFYFLFFGIQGKKTSPATTSKPQIPFFETFTKSLSAAMSSFIYITSCILFFSFLLSLIKQIFSPTALIESLISLFLELTAGIDSLKHLPFHMAFPLCAAGVGFGGCSVHLQTLGVIEKAKLSPKLYFLGKAVFSLLLFLLAIFSQKCL